MRIRQRSLEFYFSREFVRTGFFTQTFVYAFPKTDPVNVNVNVNVNVSYTDGRG
jgi:hypothetical protein